MIIIEFENEEDYGKSMTILIEMHETNPPPKREGNPFHFVRDAEADEFKARLDCESIKYSEV